MNAVVARIGARGWFLFATMSLLWGMPYLFIKQAVDSYSPASVVAGRTLIGAIVLLPFALRSKALGPAFRRIGWVLAFGALEMGGPFMLLSHAEQTIDSGLAGLLVATVPLFGALIAFFGGDRGVFRPARAIGLGLGFVGVALVVMGPGMATGATHLLAVGEVLLVAVCYAVVPFIVVHKLQDVPTLGAITVSLSAVGLVYLPIGLLTQHETPTASSTTALVALGLLCTALAFIAFFALIREVGPARAPLFTYVNPVVAVILGAIVLAEPITPGLLIGFPLVVIGCWLAATGGLRLRRRDRDLPPVVQG